MAKSDLPPSHILRQLLRYEAETGNLYWREPRPSWWRAPWRGGQEALAYLTPNGYRRGCLLGVKHMAHVVVWALVNGQTPDGEIDHVNGDRADNRIENLRLVTASGNARNRCRRKDNLSGVAGVCRAGRLWQANIAGDAGEWLYLGRFPTKDEAIAVRRAAEVGRGFTERHGQ